MVRVIMAVLAATLLTAPVSGCTGDLNETQQNELSSEFRCTLQPGRKCRP